jgi:hypothetical protein
LGSPLIPYTADKDSSKSSQSNPKTLEHSVDNRKELKTCVVGIVYVGGHKAYPKGGNTMMFVYSDRIDIGADKEKTGISVPYSEIINIENMDDKKISAERVILFGVIGAIWKKKHIYTVIRYREELDEQTIVLDFEDNLEVLQPYIYRKMLEHRKNKQLPT